MCNDDTKGNSLICFISRILFQLKLIFQKEKTTTLIFAKFSRNLALVNDLIPSQTNDILVTTSYI